MLVRMRAAAARDGDGMIPVDGWLDGEGWMDGWGWMDGRGTADGGGWTGEMGGRASYPPRYSNDAGDVVSDGHTPGGVKMATGGGHPSGPARRHPDRLTRTQTGLAGRCRQSPSNRQARGLSLLAGVWLVRLHHGSPRMVFERANTIPVASPWELFLLHRLPLPLVPVPHSSSSSSPFCSS